MYVGICIYAHVIIDIAAVHLRLNATLFGVEAYTQVPTSVL